MSLNRASFLAWIAVAVLLVACGRPPTELGSDVATGTPSSLAAATPACVASGPGLRLAAALAYDSVQRELLLFGGDVPSPPSMTASGETWVRRSANCWARLGASSGPAARSNAAVGFDSSRNETVMFGGEQSTPGKSPIFLIDTWLWNGTAWSSVRGTPSPALSLPVGAFDVATRQFIVFGVPETGPPAQTWAWDGAIWSQLHPSTTPLARFDAMMAYDYTTRTIVLFGGYNDGVGALSDTWTWDGTDWHQEFPATAPSPRIGGSMCSGQVLVLFGGSGLSSPATAETWVWGNHNWTAIRPPHAPTARRFGACAFTGTETIVMGGQDATGRLLGDAWAFHDLDWRAMQ